MLCDDAVVTAYDADQWSDFAVGVAGAAAALAGLLFVAVSLNLRQILSYPHLTGRAGTTLAALGALLLVSLCLLTPRQSRSWLGLEISVIAASLLAIVVRTNLKARRQPGQPLHWFLLALLVLLIPAVLLLVGGISVLLGAGGGLYWVMAGVATCFAASLLNAWVLLIEIER